MEYFFSDKLNVKVKGGKYYYLIDFQESKPHMDEKKYKVCD